MSQFPGNPFAPLHRSLINPRAAFAVAEEMNPDQFDPYNPAQRLQHAHALGVRRAAARQAGGLSRMGSPFTQQVLASKAQQQMEPQTAQLPQHDFGNSGTPGSIEISQGHGPNSMSSDALNAWMKRAQASAPQLGEQVTPNQPSMSQVLQGAAPGHGAGFRVTGGAVNAPAAADPLAQAFASFKGHVPDEVLVQHQQAINGGVLSPQQAFHSLQTIAHQQQLAAQQQQAAQGRQDIMAKKETFKKAAGDLKKFEKDTEAVGFDANRAPADFVHPGPFGSQTIRPQDASRLQEHAQLQNAAHQAEEALHPALHPPQQGHPLDPQTAHAILQQAGGDKAKARELAQQAGWSL